MEERKIDFAGRSVPIIHHEGVDWVAIRPVLEYLYMGEGYANEIARMARKYDVTTFALPSRNGHVRHQRVLHFGQLETWLYSFANRRSNFKVPDKDFLGRVKHARKVLPDLIFSSVPVEPEPESAVVEPNSEPATPDTPPEPTPPDPTPQMRAQTYTAFPLGTLTGVIGAVIESTEMQIAILTEFKEAFEEMLNSEFLLADNHLNGRQSEPQ